MRPVGVGELLARLEHLKRVLRSEGLFDTARKRPLPFLPRTVGLVCGRASAAERDVVENARLRWPAVRFEVREVAVQGPNAVTEVVAALAELDADPAVDVVVLARGGGSVEDLLPFSNEALVRAGGRGPHPVVSAIGHEVDSPLVDLVADVRASTPTDAPASSSPTSSRSWPGSASSGRGRGGPSRAASSARSTRSPPCAAGRSSPRRTSCSTRGRPRSTGCASGRAGPCRGAWTGPPSTSSTCGRACGRCPPARRCCAATRWCSGRTAASSGRPQDAPAGTALRLRLADGEVAATAG